MFLLALSEVQSQQTEADEPGSVQYNYQVWRQQRNENVIKDTQTQAPIAGKSYSSNSNMIFNNSFTETCSWERHVATLPTNSHPLTMAFHSFDKQLIIANESDMIRCVVS